MQFCVLARRAQGAPRRGAGAGVCAQKRVIEGGAISGAIGTGQYIGMERQGDRSATDGIADVVHCTA
jgi:hypothetical protein